ncbi:MAG TPA: mechanosensitive ion channel [Blastocatellia bacterium]|nr:mechanosensitive ion channel [Blastocatellia bacterium]
MYQLRNMGDATWYSFTNSLNTFMGFIPALIGAIILLVVGWFISGLLARLIARGLNAIGLERAVERSGIGRFIEESNTRWTMSQIIAALIKWSIFLIFIQAAASLFGFPQVTGIINSVILFIPKLIVALAIIVLGALLAKFLAGLVRGSLSEMGARNSGLFSKLTKYAIIGFAIIAAFNQIGIAQTVVNALLFGFIGSLALALGLAFGLGGREVAAQITRSWYEKGQVLADKFKQRSEEFPHRDVYTPRMGEPGGFEPRAGD